MSSCWPTSDVKSDLTVRTRLQSVQALRCKELLRHLLYERSFIRITLLRVKKNSIEKHKKNNANAAQDMCQLVPFYSWVGNAMNIPLLSFKVTYTPSTSPPPLYSSLYPLPLWIRIFHINRDNFSYCFRTHSGRASRNKSLLKKQRKSLVILFIYYYYFYTSRVYEMKKKM